MSQPNDIRHHHTSQLGADAIAPPAGLDSLPPPAPALHHLSDEHTIESQVGPAAIAPPQFAPATGLPAPVPAQHHLDDSASSTATTRTATTAATTKTLESTTTAAAAAQASPATPSSASTPEPADARHTTASQLGPSAVAAPALPASQVVVPQPAPALHHDRDHHTYETQLGRPAIAPTADLLQSPWRADGEVDETDLERGAK